MIGDRIRFPAKIALAAFLLYALTLSWGVTQTNLSLAAKLAGWDWQPLATWPLVWLLTLPLRLLPAGWLVPALNLLAAAVAALTLGVLARSVDLLPWGYQPARQRPWLRRWPMILGALVCGLGFTFWQAATAATGEMLDLLLMASSVCCLLEFRASREASREGAGREEVRWLSAAALVWGLGMAENWVMLFLLPLFALSVIFLRGLEFVDRPFLFRQARLGLAGFSVWLLLPLVNWLNPHSPLDFHGAWLASLRPIHGMMAMVFYEFMIWHQLLVAAVLMYFLLPVVACFVQMSNEGAVTASELDSFQILVYRVLRVVLLVTCLWLEFDPVVGLRAILRHTLTIALPMVTFDYLNALGIAFIAGRLIYAAQAATDHHPFKLFEQLNHGMRRAGAVLVAGIFLVFVAALLHRNLPAIWLVNRQPLQNFGRLVVRSLPAGGGVLLESDPVKQRVVQAALAQAGLNRSWQVVDMNLLSNPKYRARLERQKPSGWRADGRPLEAREILTLLTNLARTQRLVVLQAHPGDALLEYFQPVPLGGVTELQPSPPGSLDRPPLPPERIDALEHFWDAVMARPPTLKSAARRARRMSDWRDWLMLEPVAGEQSRQLCGWYSAALNDWGVQLQANGQLLPARQRFAQARAMNPYNLAAEVNSLCCTNLLAGKTLNLASLSQVADRFGSLQELTRVIDACGEFDEPAIHCVIGNACLAAGWPRQAWQEFDRARTLAPATLTPDLELGQVYIYVRQDAKVWAILNRLRAKINETSNPQLGIDVAMLEARYWMAQTNAARADHILGGLLEKHPGDPVFADMVFKSYLLFGQATNALQIVNAQLARTPNSLAALNNKAALLILTRNATAAIPVLDQILAQTNIPAIRLNRAVAYLQLGNFAGAQQDFAQLENTAANQFSVEFGLAEIAASRRDVAATVKYLKLCLAHTTRDSAQWQAVSTQLDSLTNTASRTDH